MKTLSTTTYFIDSDIPVFGHEVPTFPSGVGEAFEEIVQWLPGGFDRPFFGISRMDGQRMIYVAGALEKFPGEGKPKFPQILAIEKGHYAVSELIGWKENVASIKDVFVGMVENIPNADLAKPCVEWYFDDDKMWCMIKLKEGV